MDLELAASKALEELKREFGDLGFRKQYINKDNVLELYIESITLGDYKDSIRISLELSKGSMAYFSFSFDYLEKNLETLALINTFNANNLFFKAFIHDRGYLVLENNYAVYSEEEFANQCVQFMLRGNRLAEDKNLQALTALTTSEPKEKKN